MNKDSSNFPVGHSGEYGGIIPIHSLDSTRTIHASELGYYDEPDQDSIDFWALAQILLSRKWMILAITILGMAIAFVLTLRVVPLYAATATIEIQQQEIQIIEGANVGPDVVADSTYMETQFRLLRSRYLAERVADDLNLPNDPRYASAGANRDTRVLQAAQRIVGGLRVAPSGRSRVVGVTFVSAYPQEAARIANAVVDAYIQSNLERKYNTTAFAREFLDERLAATKSALEESERRFVKYAEDQGLLDIGGATSGAGSLDENSIIALNNELSSAESERIRAEQEYKAAQDSAPVRELMQSPALTSLRQTRSNLVTDYQEMLGRFKPDYPDMVRLQARIDGIEQEIQRETASITNSVIDELKLNFEAAVARENSLRVRVNELQGNLQDERNRRIQYRILQREVETIQSQYQGLLQRSKEVSVASGVGSSNVSIVDSALVPGRPFQPDFPRSLLQAFVLSLAFGVGLAFVLKFVDDTIKTPEDVRQKLGLPAIGVVPKISGKRDLVAYELQQPKSAISEAFESARTALDFTSEEGCPKSILVTSTRPGEGKTSTTIALATVFARGGKSVLIIDGDMRKPSFIVDSNRSIGLSGLLTGHDDLQEHVVRSKTDGLSVLPAGVVPPNPAQLLSGVRLGEIIREAEGLFDVVIVDSPPLLSFTDSPRLGAAVAGALVVIQSGLVRTPAAKRTVSQLFESRTNIIGCVLTKFEAKRAGYDYSYYYSSYGRDASAYIESNNRSDKKRKILIESADDAAASNETERWA